MEYSYPEIVQYPPPEEDRIVYLDVPEYHHLHMKYCNTKKEYTLYHEINEIFNRLYDARNLQSSEYNITESFELANNIGLNLEKDFGLTWQEGTYLMYLEFEQKVELFNRVKDALLSVGLLTLKDSYVNSLLRDVENKIEYYVKRRDAMLKDLFE